MFPTFIFDHSMWDAFTHGVIRMRACTGYTGNTQQAQGTRYIRRVGLPVPVLRKQAQARKRARKQAKQSRRRNRGQ